MKHAHGQQNCRRIAQENVKQQEKKPPDFKDKKGSVYFEKKAKESKNGLRENQRVRVHNGEISN
jgi:hypothetical protein